MKYGGLNCKTQHLLQKYGKEKLKEKNEPKKPFERDVKKKEK